MSACMDHPALHQQHAKATHPCTMVFTSHKRHCYSSKAYHISVTGSDPYSARQPRPVLTQECHTVTFCNLEGLQQVKLMLVAQTKLQQCGAQISTILMQP